MANSGSDSLLSPLAGDCDYVNVYDYCCDLCLQGGKHVKATGYCLDCQDYLCIECFTTHLRPKPMRHHVLLDQHQMPKDQQQIRSGDTCTEVCTIHPQKALEYFCSDHNVLGCTACMTLNHRNCQGVDHIPDIARDILSNVEYTDLQKKITALIQITTTANQTSQVEADCSQTYHANALVALEQLQKDISEAIDRIKKTIIKEADKLKGEDDEKMKLLGDKYKTVLKDIQKFSSKFTSLHNNGQFCQMFIAMKRAKSEIDAIEARLGDPRRDTEARNYRLVKSREVQMLLDYPETMVKLEIFKDNQSGSILAQTDTSVKQAQRTHQRKTLQAAVSSPLHKIPATSQHGETGLTSRSKAPVPRAAAHYTRDVGETRAQHVMDINVRFRDDSDTSYITGCVVLPADKLVLVDKENSKVKLIDLAQNNIVSQLKLPGGVWDIAQVNSSQVAVTSYSNQTIYLVNLSVKLKLDHKMKVKGQCWGITSINDNLVVSYVEPVKVEIISMKGKVLQTVVKADTGRQLFTSPCHVAVSNDQQTIYISDYDRETVTSVALTGQVLATYKDDKLMRPRGLTVDKAGTVYVCVCGVFPYSTIFQLTADLTEGQELLQQSDGVLHPVSICFCETTDRLYIGMYNNVVKVYKLK